MPLQMHTPKSQLIRDSNVWTWLVLQIQHPEKLPRRRERNQEGKMLEKRSVAPAGVEA